jgi:hypothetical protein
MKKLF